MAQAEQLLQTRRRRLHRSAAQMHGNDQRLTALEVAWIKRSLCEGRSVQYCANRLNRRYYTVYKAAQSMDVPAYDPNKDPAIINSSFCWGGLNHAPGYMRTENLTVSASVRRCRFPLWGDEDYPTHEYCAEPTATGSSYCSRHHERTHVPHGQKKLD